MTPHFSLVELGKNVLIIYLLSMVHTIVSEKCSGTASTFFRSRQQVHLEHHYLCAYQTSVLTWYIPAECL
jgi:hypothetical protein